MIKMGRGNLNAKVWVVGPHVLKQDVGQIFTHQSGMLLYNTLLTLGVTEREIRSEVLVYDIPRGSKFTYFEEHKMSAIVEGVQKLEMAIKAHKPNLVVALGSSVIKYLIGQTNIMNWRGHIVWSDRLQCKILPMITPSSAMRQKHVHKSKKPGQYLALFINDVHKIKKEMQFAGMKQDDPTVITAPPFSEAKAILEQMYEDGSLLSYDIECPQPYKAHLVDCIGLATEKDWGVSIPFWTVVGAKGHQTLSKYYGAHELPIIMGLVKKLLASPMPKVAQNSKFDSAILEAWYGMPVNNLAWDTMVMAHNLYCDLPKDLGTLISLYTNLPYHKYLNAMGGLENRWKYNAMDAIANIHIMLGEIEEMKSLNILDHYRYCTHPTIGTTVEMHLLGVPVDIPFRDLALTKEGAIMENIIQAFNKVLPFSLDTTSNSRKFNPNSPTQKKQMFLELLGVKPTYNRGTITMNKATMAYIAKTTSDTIVKAFAEACLRYKASSTMAGKLKTPLHEGNIHTQYDTAGTDTGRLNSKASETFSGGTNLQNLSPGLQRKMIIPPKDNIWAQVSVTPK